MNDVGDHVAMVCPACSPERPTVHEILADGGTATVRCEACHHVHAARIDVDESLRSIRTVVSQEGESVTATVELPADAIVDVGQELLVETEEAIYTVEVTSIEDETGARHDRLLARATSTLWTRDVGNVVVDVTIHPPPNADATSRAAELRVPGEHAFRVGEETTIAGEPVTVHGIHLRREVDDELRKLNRPDDTALARDIARLYVRSRRSVPRSPWR